MDILTQLSSDLKEAMRSKDMLRVETIRGALSAIRSKEMETSKSLDEATTMAVLKSLVKQRVDSIAQFKEGGRNDLVEKESLEKEILESYLPEAPDEAAIEKAVLAAIEQSGASGMKDMGKVMQICKSELGPTVDGKILSNLVRSKLNA
ncbi:MAG: GatB/YqeY domain-containing protein [Myxococcales bacterium]|nr:MAG: GatB/YqeY domain-containing protein [Myxococcales bacterium]